MCESSCPIATRALVLLRNQMRSELASSIALKSKIIFLFSGILVIELLNVIRFMLLVLYWNSADTKIIDHHTIFNVIIYIIIIISLYFWVKNPGSENKKYAAN